MKPYLLTSLLAVGLAHHAMAQDPHEASGSDWILMVGAMGNQEPRYLGSDENHFTAEPFGMFDYKGRVGLRDSRIMDGTVGFYARPLLTETWGLGILAMTEMDARTEASAKALKGMGDRSANVFAGMDLTFRKGEFNAALEVLRGTKDQSGMVAGLELGHSYRITEQLGLEVGLTGIWGNKDYQAWEFGITSAQAARRQALIQAGNTDLRPADARPFTPRAGMREVRASASLQWEVRPRWTTFGTLQYGRLLGDAADSPLARRRNQTRAGIGCAYRFGGGPGDRPHAD